MAGLRPCLWTVLQCKEQDFQRFLGVDSEEAAVQRVKEVCRIRTRKQLDHEPAAQALWNEEIRRPFLQFQQHPTTHHNQDQEM